MTEAEMWGLWFAAVLIVCTLLCWVWDRNLLRRDPRPDVGLSILRSDRDDASEAELWCWGDVLRETADAGLTTASDASHPRRTQAGSFPARHMAGRPGGNPVRIRRSPYVEIRATQAGLNSAGPNASFGAETCIPPAWDQPTGELPAVQLLPVWPARARALPLPMSVSMVTPQPWMRGERRYVQPALVEVA